MYTCMQMHTCMQMQMHRVDTRMRTCSGKREPPETPVGSSPQAWGSMFCCGQHVALNATNVGSQRVKVEDVVLIEQQPQHRRQSSVSGSIIGHVAPQRRFRGRPRNAVCAFVKEDSDNNPSNGPQTLENSEIFGGPGPIFGDFRWNLGSRTVGNASGDLYGPFWTNFQTIWWHLDRFRSKCRKIHNFCGPVSP